MSFQLSSVLAGRGDGLDLVAVEDCNGAGSVESGLSCVSGYLMNIVELIVVGVVAEMKQQKNLIDTFSFFDNLHNLRVYWQLS